jgi:predicted AAA+ superfamily ATPase
VAIDEIQKVPALMDEVHSLLEDFKGRIIFLLSGSSARKLRRGGANLLAGRAIGRFLHPLHQSEIPLNLNKVLKFGSLPAMYLNSEDVAKESLESYVSTYLREEIQQESIVRSIERFSRFLDFAGQVNGEPVNFSKLGKQIGIAGKTVAEYFSILVDTLIAIQIPGWSQSVKKQLLQSSKYYFFDTGVLNALNGYLQVDLKEISFLYGRLFETFIISQISAANDYEGLSLKFYYWRDKNGSEVDLILARNVAEPIAAIEIKSSASPDVDDFPGFKSFAEDYPDVPKICICTSERSYSSHGILVEPWQSGVSDLMDLIERARSLPQYQAR